MSLKGIDISKHNGSINWDEVAKSVDFVIIRAGYGDFISQVDSQFETNIKNALAKGLNVGCYWFSYAISASDAQKEASVFKQVLAPYKGRLLMPVAFDYEYDSMNNSTKNGVTPTNALIDSIAHAFLDSMKSDGWFVNIYTNCDFIRTGRFSSSTIQSYDVWLADYSGGPDYTCTIQQTGENGSVSGVIGNVDTDICYKDYPTIIRSGGYNGFAKSTIFKIDTGTRLNVFKGNSYTYKVTAVAQPNIAVANGDSIFHGALASHSGEDYFYQVTATGSVGSSAGLYVNGQRTTVMTIIDPSNFTSDTHNNVNVSKGSTYQLKITSPTGATPRFQTAAGFTIVGQSQTGNDHYYKVQATGSVGTNTGFYVNGVRTAIGVIV
jgi:GH25 family lysozyme M1 (1,4-beta-N-acetylmuramidase)